MDWFNKKYDEISILLSKTAYDIVFNYYGYIEIDFA